MVSVFLSSTYRDLVEHRRLIADSLRHADFQPIAMEYLVASPEPPLDLCLFEVAKADLFVGIYAWRYGFVPQGHSKSITELEFDEAQRKNKPCFCFLIDDSYEGSSSPSRR